MTQQEDRVQHQSASSIRGEVFAHRMRGLDEDEVREYLDQLADQIEATDVEIARLRSENNRLRDEVDKSSTEISPQAVALFSQAQQVADQLVEEAVIHARDLMMSARNQQRDIVQRAHDAAEEVVRRTTAHQVAPQAGTGQPGYTTPVPEVEYVRTFARVAQVQLRSVLDALTEQVDRLGEVPRLEQGGSEFKPQTLPLPHSQAQQDPLEADPESDSDDESDMSSIYQQVWSIQGRPFE